MISLSNGLEMLVLVKICLLMLLTMLVERSSLSGHIVLGYTRKVMLHFIEVVTDFAVKFLLIDAPFWFHRCWYWHPLCSSATCRQEWFLYVVLWIVKAANWSNWIACKLKNTIYLSFVAFNFIITIIIKFRP